MGHHGQAVPQRPAVAAGLHVPIPLCRCCTATRFGGLRGDRLHGHGGGCLLPARRRARAARCTRRGGPRRRSPILLRIHGHGVRAHRRPGHRGHHRPGSANSLRRRGVDHRAARDLPTAGAPPTAATPPARRAVGGGAHVGCHPVASRTAHHTIVFGDAWERTFTDIIRDGQLMRDPSLLVTRPTASDASLAPAGRDLLYVLAPAPNLSRRGIDWSPSRHRTRTRCSRRCRTGCCRASATMPNCCTSTPPPTGAAKAWPPGHRLRWRIPSLRPGRFGRQIWCAASRMWYWPGRRRCPAWACQPR